MSSRYNLRSAAMMQGNPLAHRRANCEAADNRRRSLDRHNGQRSVSSKMNSIIRAMAVIAPGFNVNMFVESLYLEIKRQLYLRGWRVRGNVPNIAGDEPLVAQIKALLVREGLRVYDLLEFQDRRVCIILRNRGFNIDRRSFH